MRPEKLDAIDPVDLGLLQQMQLDPTTRSVVSVVVHETQERLFIREEELLTQEFFPNLLSLYRREYRLVPRKVSVKVSDVGKTKDGRWYLGGRLENGREVTVLVHATNDLFSRN